MKEERIEINENTSRKEITLTPVCCSRVRTTEPGPSTVGIHKQSSAASKKEVML